MLNHIQMSDNHKPGLAGAILLALLPGWLACQEPDVPAPGDHMAALFGPIRTMESCWTS